MSDSYVTLANKRLATLVDLEGEHSLKVVIDGIVDGEVNITGDVVVDTFGALTDAAETDPDAASATMPSLLRGLLTVAAKESGGNLDDITAAVEAMATAIGTAADDAGDPTVIGLLKQIAANTTSE